MRDYHTLREEDNSEITYNIYTRAFVGDVKTISASAGVFDLIDAITLINSN